MAVKIMKPVTPGMRGAVFVDKGSLWRGSPEKSLTVGMSKTGGRNCYGRITTRHIGGGARKKYRMVDFVRSKVGFSGVVKRLEYDPNRTAHIAFIEYTDGDVAYIVAPDNLSVGDIIESGCEAPLTVGNALPLYCMKEGAVVHNVEMKPGKGGQFVRSAGSFARIMGKYKGYVTLRLPSGRMCKVPDTCMATIGVVSNPDNKNLKIGKAGLNRHRGKRPSVRGVAMNPVDHPHGGGEGKTSGGRHPCTPWGKPTKGAKTANKKKQKRKLISKVVR